MSAAAQLGRCDTVLVTNIADAGPGSLRQAIIFANTNAGLDTINFQISGSPPFSITNLSALPAISDPVVIDATTQPGYAGKPVVELNGISAGASTIGLRFSSDGNTLRGLALNRFGVQAVELDGAANVIQGNFIGTDVTGLLQRDNGAYGILVKSSGNLIGGTNAGNGNVISAGTNVNSAGVYVLAASNNVIQGNLIGVSAAGTNGFSSVNNGVILFNSSSNLIGGPSAAARNIISGNGGSGVYITGAGSTANLIQGNRIGTDIFGSNVVANAGDGIVLVSAPGNVIHSNLISGNNLAGISFQGAGGGGNRIFGNFIGTDVNGTLARTNRSSGVFVSDTGGNFIGGTNAGEGNVISGNSLDGITLTGGTSGNVIRGNRIGLSAAGNAALRNIENGITISSSTSNTIGGTVAAARNVISGNFTNGIVIDLTTDVGNVIQGNYIGTDINGTAAVANKLAGILLEGCSNIIGGTVTGSGNVISGNTQQGIWILGASGNVKGNLIQGNRIGLNASGSNSVANGSASAASAGIGISTASANMIGGSAPGARNLISGNNGAGIFLVGFTASSNVIQGNYIGADVNGNRALGNSFEGIYMEQAGTNQIGGTAAGAGNLISGNNFQGMFLTNSSWNVIQGNFIGTQADGVNSLGNGEHGIEFQAKANNNMVGGVAAGAGNRLAYAGNVYCGVRVRTSASKNLVSGNSIFSNGALGIDLSPTDGGTSAGINAIVACETGVAASAANAGQNFPTLSNVYSGTMIRVRGSLNSKVSQNYTLQFFASPGGDASGNGEGQLYLGQTNLTLGASSCSSNFTAFLTGSVSNGWVVTATATDPNNNTSEFSAWVPVFQVPRLLLANSTNTQFSISWTNNGGTYALQQATNLTPPVVWLSVSNVPLLVSNFMVTTLVKTNQSVFYRLTVP